MSHLFQPTRSTKTMSLPTRFVKNKEKDENLWFFRFRVLDLYKRMLWECVYIKRNVLILNLKCANFAKMQLKCAFIAQTNNKFLNKTKLGRDWHQGEEKFKNSLGRAFRANGHLVAPDEIEGKIKHAEFVEKEILALYSLKKYRTMKNRYGDKARVLEKTESKFAWG